MKKEKTIILRACGCCGDPHVIVARPRSGEWIAACGGCPCHVYGSTEEEARKKWNEEARKNAGSGKGN